MNKFTRGILSVLVAGTLAAPLTVSTSAVAAAACNSSGSLGCIGSSSAPRNVAANLPEKSPSIPVSDRSSAEWVQTFRDDFNRSEPGPGWPAYTGAAGGNPDNKWTASQVTVRNGALRLTGEYNGQRWITGGTMDVRHPQQYGRWDFRMRADRSDEISYHMLLWPQNESWPPEIDIAESTDSNRRQMSAFLHWKDSLGARSKREFRSSGHYDQWHTMSVEWLPNRITWLQNGVPFAEVTDRRIIPHTPMRLAMQVESGSCQRRVEFGQPPCPAKMSMTPASVEVDYVAVYRPA